MQSISLSNVSIEIPEVVSTQQPNPFHKEAAWSLYDAKGNIYSLSKQTLFLLHDAIELASDIAQEGGTVRIRWEAESLSEV